MSNVSGSTFCVAKTAPPLPMGKGGQVGQSLVQKRWGLRGLLSGWGPLDHPDGIRSAHWVGWVMCFLSVTPVGQQRTAHAFFMILGSSVRSRSLEKRLGGQGDKSCLGGLDDLEVPGQGLQVGQTSGGG